MDYMSVEEAAQKWGISISGIMSFDEDGCLFWCRIFDSIR